MSEVLADERDYDDNHPDPSVPHASVVTVVWIP